MRSRVVAARAPHRVPYPVAIALITVLVTAMLLAMPGRARGQAEWNIGPFLDYASIHGGHPASAGLETSVLVGPVGLRVSGFSALDQPYASSMTSSNDVPPRWGGDADLMFIFDFASRGSGGGGIAPYVFAGAGLGVYNNSSAFFSNNYNSAQVEGGWSYGGGVLLPIGSALEAMGEIRARPSGFFNVTPSTRPTYTQIRVGLSVRLGSAWGGSRYRSAPDDPPRPPRPRRRSTTDDAFRIILGGVSEAGGAIAPPASAARVIPTAERYLGTPYRYGGTSPVTGFDCSGFVQYVFARNSVRLPRTSRQQAKTGTPMPRNFDRLAPGDLVMFAERGEPISHVAIYAGHHRIIHATSSGGEVRYDDLTTRRGKWFVAHLVAARRVTPDARGLMLDLAKMLDAKSLADTALDIGDLAPRR
jgi:cell wall-associated NlpC family hydrolase